MPPHASVPSDIMMISPAKTAHNAIKLALAAT